MFYFFGGEVKRGSRRAFTLLELLIGVSIISILIAAAGFQLKGVIQRTKVSAAKTTINGFGLALSMVKGDTCFYPVELAHVKEASVPEGFPQTSQGYWYGPYGGRLSLTDPWGNPYVYELTEGSVFGPETVVRETGGAVYHKFTFSAVAGKGTLVVDNHAQIHAGRIWINGVEVVHPNEFQNSIPIITKEVSLQSSNLLKVKLQSNPGHYIIIIATSPFSKDSTFDLRSYGRDRAPGGMKYDADVIYGEF